MKKFIGIFITLLTLTIQTVAQDTWTVKVDGKTVLKADGEDEASNVIQLKKSAPAKKLSISIPDSETPSGWTRSILVFGKDDTQLLKQTIKGEASISASTMSKLLATDNTLKFYTISLPDDPDHAARVRVRRVHLCTLESR